METAQTEQVFHPLTTW